MSRLPHAEAIIEQTYPGITRCTVLLGGPADDGFKKSRMIDEIGRTHHGEIERTGDDRHELFGTGTLMSLAGGKVKGVLTAGHVITAIMKQQTQAKLQNGPFIRISGAGDRGVNPGKSYEHTVVLRQPWTQVWGDNPTIKGDGKGWDPDLAFVRIPDAHAGEMGSRWDVRFEPWDGREGRIKRQKEKASETARVAVGMLGERQRRGKENHRVLLGIASWPGKEAGYLTADNHEVWTYSLEAGQDERSVEMRRSTEKQSWTEGAGDTIGTCGGMSGGGMWSVFWRPDRAPPNMTWELQSVLFAESWKGAGLERSVTSLVSVGSGTIKRFLETVVENLRDK